ncbi:MAG: ABC transporter substrate binding protein [Myxococcota bacterium]
MTTLLLFSLSAFAIRPEVAVVVSDDLEPYEAPVAAFKEALGVPVQTINLHGREIEAEVEMAALRQANPKVVFAIGAKAAYAARFRLPSTPLVYAQVHDPERYGIRGNQTTGVHAKVPAVTYLSQVQSFFPGVRSIGILRGPMDADERSALEAASQEVGIELQVREVSSPRDFRKAFNQLVDDVDAIWLSPDREVLSPEAFRTAVQEMRRRQKPLLSDTANMVSAGAAFAVTPDTAGVGRQAAEIAARILDGAAPAVIDVQDPLELSTALNKRTLEAGTIAYEPLMLDFANLIVE